MLVVVVELRKMGFLQVVVMVGLVVRVTPLLSQEQTKSSVQEVVVVVDLLYWMA